MAMTWQELSFDPLLSVREEFGFDPATEEFQVRTTTFDDGIVDRAKAEANEGINEAGLKSGFWRYATLPAGVVLEMRRKGIIIGRADHGKRIIKEINENYPWLKTTHRHHS